MSVSVTWYGERGIVNALVTELASSGLEKAKGFLGAIDWSNGQHAHWIEDIQEIDFLVELNCGQFGSPDLVVVCRTAASGTHGLFVEAKVGGYCQSAVHNTPQAMTDVDGFNSRINGQLALKYRLAKALSCWSGHGELIEPAPLCKGYDTWLGDRRERARRLVNPSVLQILREKGLHESPTTFHYVAWTRDAELFGAAGDNLLPLFLSPDDPAQRVTESLGWLGYDKLAGRVALGRIYQDAAKAMHRLRSQPTRSARFRAGQLADEAPSSVRDILELAEAWFGPDVIDVTETSVSLWRASQVQAKLCLSADGLVWLGARADLDLPKWWPEDSERITRSFGGGRNRVVFEMARLPADESAARDAAGRLLAALNEQAPSG